MSTSKKIDLPETLADEFRFARANGYSSVNWRKSFIALNLVQDIEAGLELFMSPNVRLKLSRALRVRPDVLKEVEKFLLTAEEEALEQAKPEACRIQAKMAEVSSIR